MLLEIRCGQCHKLLAKGSGHLEIKCPRCKTINHLRDRESRQSDRPRATPESQHVQPDQTAARRLDGR
ncbi:zinc finger domain-containing protein [Candidatus Magnetaquiglobus chichijimensis]|uniref:zinc finger domain-containing protein n=1 Tax=Candidatus Magnetaquiglobus chichijimensis TaxID=3141448 RepID=UPI003B96E484